MIDDLSLDKADLWRVFALTGGASLLISIVAVFFSAEWAVRYGVLAAIALLNWIALALILIGITGGDLNELLMGAFLKPATLAGFFVYAMRMEVEASSLIMGMNTFFLSLFVYMAWQRAVAIRCEPVREMIDLDVKKPNG